MRAAAWSLILLGCGRVGFTSVEVGDATTATCLPAQETCNGIDDDCNGVVDEGCPCTPFDVTIPLPATATSNLVWTGRGYLAKAGDTTIDVVQPISATGVLGTPQPIAPRSDTFNAMGFQALAWNGSELALMWTRVSNQIVLSRFDADALPIGAPIDISTTATAFEPAITWAGDHFAIAWRDNRSGANDVYLREVAADGTPLTPELALPITGTVMEILPVADHYLLDIGQLTEPSFTVAVARDGTVLATHTLEFPGSTVDGAHVAAGPGGFVATRTRNTMFDTAWMTLDGDGAPTGVATASPMFNGHSISSIAPDGRRDRYVVLGLTNGNPYEVVELDLDGTGAIIAGPDLITTFSAGGTATPTAVVADQRRAFGIPTSTPGQLRVIQQCR